MEDEEGGEVVIGGAFVLIFSLISVVFCCVGSFSSSPHPHISALFWSLLFVFTVVSGGVVAFVGVVVGVVGVEGVVEGVEVVEVVGGAFVEVVPFVEVGGVVEGMVFVVEVEGEAIEGVGGSECTKFSRFAVGSLLLLLILGVVATSSLLFALLGWCLCLLRCGLFVIAAKGMCALSARSRSASCACIKYGSESSCALEATRAASASSLHSRPRIPVISYAMVNLQNSAPGSV